MPSLWFVMPVHGRLPLATICLRALRRTCLTLKDRGIDASAVVIADAHNLNELADRLGGDVWFATAERDNTFLSVKYNDGIQVACDPAYNPRPVDYVVPCGSDDWVHPDVFTDLPGPDALLGFQHISFVREDGRELTSRFLDYPGGSGIRVIPRALVERLGYRPADEWRKRACDTSILVNIKRHVGVLRIEHGAIDPRMIVDWKSPGQQLNTYQDVSARYRAHELVDPFKALAGLWPADLLRDMQAHYARVRPRVAA